MPWVVAVVWKMLMRFVDTKALEIMFLNDTAKTKIRVKCYIPAF